MLEGRVRIPTPCRLIGKLAVICLVAVWPLRAAHAYVDPNSAGPLYQLLFPMLIAIGSVIAAGRRALRRAWNRIVASIVRTGPHSEEGS